MMLRSCRNHSGHQGSPCEHRFAHTVEGVVPTWHPHCAREEEAAPLHLHRRADGEHELRKHVLHIRYAALHPLVCAEAPDALEAKADQADVRSAFKKDGPEDCEDFVRERHVSESEVCYRKLSDRDAHEVTGALRHVFQDGQRFVAASGAPVDQHVAVHRATVDDRLAMLLVRSTHRQHHGDVEEAPASDQKSRTWPSATLGLELFVEGRHLRLQNVIGHLLATPKTAQVSAGANEGDNAGHRKGRRILRSMVCRHWLLCRLRRKHFVQCSGHLGPRRTTTNRVAKPRCHPGCEDDAVQDLQGANFGQPEHGELRRPRAHDLCVRQAPHLRANT